MVSGIKSAELKLIWAAKHLRAIKRCAKAYSASQPHNLAVKAQGKMKVNVPKAPPRTISILAGEMVYQMRSALDHLTFEIIKQNPHVGSIDAEWREHCQFPLKTKLPKKSTPPLAKSQFSRNLPGISDKAFAVIEQMQPYYRTGAINNALRFLAHLSNIDKHRYLNLIRPRVRQRHYIKFSSGVSVGGWEIFDRGAIITHPRSARELDRPVYVNRRYSTLVAFNEREHLGEANAMPVDHLLFVILYHIQTFVVPALRELIKKP